MSDNTTIEWTDATWNPVVGCSVLSPGCTNCYAMKLAGTRLRHTPSREGLTVPSKSGPVWNGRVRMMEQWLTQPLTWKRPRRIFVCAHGDLFHDAVPDEWIDRVFAVMALAPQHTFQVLTKRAARMQAYIEHLVVCPKRFTTWASRGADIAREAKLERTAPPKHPLPNVHLGVSAEDQLRADERLPHLIATPAARRFVSLEPLLGPIDATPYLFIVTHADEARLADETDDVVANPLPWNDPATTPAEEIDTPRLDWVIVGGESGRNARPMHPAWVRGLRDQCRIAEVPFFFKQWGEWRHGSTLGKQPKLDACLLNDGRIVQPIPEVSSQIDREPGGWHGKQPEMMARVGKKAAGALLDGREHREFPA